MNENLTKALHSAQFLVQELRRAAVDAASNGRVLESRVLYHHHEEAAQLQARLAETVAAIEEDAKP